MPTGNAEIAAFLADHAGFAAFGALGKHQGLTANDLLGFLCFKFPDLFSDVFFALNEPDIDQVAFDDIADGGQQGGNLMPIHPLPAARVKHGF